MIASVHDQPSEAKPIISVTYRSLKAKLGTSSFVSPPLNCRGAEIIRSRQALVMAGGIAGSAAAEDPEVFVLFHHPGHQAYQQSKMMTSV